MNKNASVSLMRHLVFFDLLLYEKTWNYYLPLIISVYTNVMVFNLTFFSLL